MSETAQTALHTAFTAWLAQQDQSSPCQEPAFVAGWQASVDQRIEDALLHYQIGRETSLGLLYVDWCYVAGRMAQALRGGDDTDTDSDTETKG